MIAVKSSENENKVYAMTLTRQCISDPNPGKAWKCDRGEVASVQVAISPLSTNPSFYPISLANRFCFIYLLYFEV